MNELPSIITDLALILVVASVVTILFKRLKQPLVLGYIMAGFLAGPHMTYMPSVTDHESIDTWSQIGVIFLMFTLGLEFSFKKIIKMGMSPVIAAVCIMLCMISVGNGVGLLFGWTGMNRLFLGGMLAMSSTTIIYKAFEDLGLRTKKFSSSVMSVLILEDILGILLMVLLSAMAVSRSVEGTQLIVALLKLGFFLLFWFLVGVFLLPLLLRNNKKFINNETLLIVSVALCFALVVMAVKAGYSPAFGAFMMGSILAETIEAEHIEHVVSPLKDLFGAIFFVSVGMLVDPNVLVQHWLPILAITGSILVGQMIFGTGSFLLSGLSLRDAMQSGFSMAQIGEFAFILASLGISLGVTSDFLYPIVVAVSIITTFLTPYMIKIAPWAYNQVEHFFPSEIVSKLNNRNRANNSSSVIVQESFTCASAWKSLMIGYVRQTVAYMTLAVAIGTLALTLVNSFLSGLLTPRFGGPLAALLVVMLLSPCLRPVVMRKNHSRPFMFLRRQSLIHRILLTLSVSIRFSIAALLPFNVLIITTQLSNVSAAFISITVVFLICLSRAVKYVSIRIERTFMQNLRRRELLRNENKPAYARTLQGRDLHIARLALPDSSLWAGKTLAQLRIGDSNAVHVVAIVRGQTRINIPGGSSMLFPGDVIEVVGDDESVELLSQRLNTEVSPQQNAMGSNMRIQRLIVSAQSQLVGKLIKTSGIRDNFHCVVIGLENQDGGLRFAGADHQIIPGDTLWVAGENEDLLKLLKIS